MSTPSASASVPGAGPVEGKSADRRSSLGKYVKRMSSVFKREKSAKTSPANAPAAAGPWDEQPANDAVTKEETAPVGYGRNLRTETETETTTTNTTRPTHNSPAPVAEPVSSSAHASPSAPTPAIVATKQLDRSAMQQERARALFAKYGLTIESHEWIAAPAPVPTVQRVEKSIRMRVHRSCHHCGTLYASDKVCLQCNHKRCKKCPRYPKKRSSPEKDQGKDVAAAEKPRKKRVLTITTKSGNELAYLPAKQRIRRTCHKCQALFMPATATICEQCRHVRCTKCPREPAKLQKWPAGYPGDVEPDSDSEVEKQLEKFRRTWRKPRQRVRWECEQCHTHFVHGSPQCPGCGHERCDRCTRSPIKKAKKEEYLDPEVVAAVEAKLRALGMDDDSHTSGPEAV